MRSGCAPPSAGLSPEPPRRDTGRVHRDPARCRRLRRPAHTRRPMKLWSSGPIGSIEYGERAADEVGDRPGWTHPGEPHGAGVRREPAQAWAYGGGRAIEPAAGQRNRAGRAPDAILARWRAIVQSRRRRPFSSVRSGTSVISETRSPRGSPPAPRSSSSSGSEPGREGRAAAGRGDCWLRRARGARGPRCAHPDGIADGGVPLHRMSRSLAVPALKDPQEPSPTRDSSRRPVNIGQPAPITRNPATCAASASQQSGVVWGRSNRPHAA